MKRKHQSQTRLARGQHNTTYRRQGIFDHLI